MAYNVVPLTKLIEQFERLPGIGRKSAQRLAFYVLNLPREKAEEFSKIILEAHEKIRGRKKIPRKSTRGRFSEERKDAFSEENTESVLIFRVFVSSRGVVADFCVEPPSPRLECRIEFTADIPRFHRFDCAFESGRQCFSEHLLLGASDKLAPRQKQRAIDQRGGRLSQGAADRGNANRCIESTL